MDPNNIANLSRNLHIYDQTETTIRELNALRCCSHLCDVNLVVEGREFPAHRVVLAASGGFFRGLFAANMKEQSENSVHLKEIDSDVIEDVLSYIYTGEIELTRDNALSIVKAADFLLLEKLKERVDEFLADIASDISDDFLSNYQLAVRHKYPLFEREAFSLVLENFTAISDSQQFLELNEETLQKIIASDNLAVMGEETVFTAVVNWVMHEPRNRKPLFNQLFSLIRLCSLNEEFLQGTILSNRLVLSNPECLSHVMKSMKGKYAPTTVNEQHPRNCLDPFTSAVLVFPEGHSVARGPWCYIPSCENWYLMPSSGNYHAWHDQGRGFPVYHSGNIFLVRSAKENRKTILHIDRYDPQTNLWLQSLPITGAFGIESQQIGCLQGIMYLVGGLSELDDLSVNDVFSCNIADVSRRSLKQVAHMNANRKAAGVVAGEKYLYAIGGQDHSDQQIVFHLRTVERYNPQADSWEYMAPMSNETSHPQCTLAHGKIFVSMGLMYSDTPRNFDQVYDISTDTWSEIPRSPRHFAKSAMIVCDGKVYVIGGAYNALKDSEDNSKDHDSNKLYTTSFDVKTNSWSTVATITLKTKGSRNSIPLGGIAVRLPKRNIAALPLLEYAKP